MVNWKEGKVVGGLTGEKSSADLVRVDFSGSELLHWGYAMFHFGTVRCGGG